MNELNRVNAILLAGDQCASIKVRGDNKTFLLLRDEPFLVHILRVLQQSRHVQNVVVVGPAKRISETLQRYTDSLEDRGGIRVVEQRENMIENFKAGYVSLLDHSGAISFADLLGTKYADSPVLVVPCDIPLLTPWEVDEFIRQSNMRDYDYSIGITSKRVLSYYHPAEGRPGIRMIYFHLREDLIRHNNLHLVKPLRFAHLDYVEKMYEWRYQTHWINILRMVFSLLRVSGRFIPALYIFILLQLSLYLDRHGHPRLSDRIRRHASLETLQKGIGKILGARTQLVYTHFGGAALDVDHDENVDTLASMYDTWMAHQNSLRDPK